MKTVNSQENHCSSLRYGFIIPLALMMASFVTSCLSFASAKTDIASDLNDAIIALAAEKADLFTRPDTIAALRKMHETTHQPLIYQAADVDFRNSALKDNVYFTIALVDDRNTTLKIRGNKISSDSVMLVPERTSEGLAVKVQGFADCTMASVFSASDQTVPGLLFVLSLLYMASMIMWQRRGIDLAPQETMTAITTADLLSGVRLTPMQRQLTLMLLDAPDRRVDKATLCSALWGNKSNAEESLYTLVRRTKAALANADLEIVCNRGDSYEIHITS